MTKGRHKFQLQAVRRVAMMSMTTPGNRSGLPDLSRMHCPLARTQIGLSLRTILYRCEAERVHAAPLPQDNEPAK